MTKKYAIDYQDVCQAAERIADQTIRTPCVFSERLSQKLGCQLYFKAECLQHVSAFKARGALNAVRCLSEAEAAAGVVTHSSGNHAAALARAAMQRGIAAHIVMPHNSAKTKIEAVRGLGVEPVFCEPTAEDRHAVAAKVQEETGATLVHPYNYPPVMAGQGTVGLEILEQVPNVDFIFAPVGGGGLISGILTAVAGHGPSQPKVVGAEPAWADDAYRGWKSGRIEQPTRYDSIADGLRSPVGELPFPIIQDTIHSIALAEESQIKFAMREIIEVAKLVAEPSGAVAYAALLSSMAQEPETWQGKTVVAVISGGNLDMASCTAGRG